ncbi:MAG: type I-F CRISPR-associated endoribonuclease Cas6/Csy4 [Desulfobulbus sp.]|jgi:CRISPR-associated endonuclease Csy4|uniref:type I-F CRISPR-associated endoribonuclease Cas6/Csy4 n=1 Tax=Desulfobulbus sp. TaxID=895 RepID=UPI00283D57EA|nr:type I-F CRISPR-associated endoribonuclease Cas6/Csy4 [Desulfobulbus sp.]MDR2549036.1 type I-F CRISPR-associated endoribonuclease Cas6/Csy4 [Desulfobulbus sp.]
MDRYIEFRLLPDPEQAPAQLMNVLYGKLHLALAELGTGDVGVSFPDAENARTPGKRLRLHGTADALNRLMKINWTAGLRDHVAQSSVMPIPTEAKFRSVYRVQAKSNPERLRRRMMKRHGVDAETAARKIPDSAVELLILPYVRIKSLSSGQYFRLFFQFGPVERQARSGAFNAYGLSRNTTVPWF